jgi:hypothetical protein
MLTCNDLAFVLHSAFEASAFEAPAIEALAFEALGFEALGVAGFAAMTGTGDPSTLGVSTDFLVTPLFAAALRGFLPCGISCDMGGTSCV